MSNKYQLLLEKYQNMQLEHSILKSKHDSKIEAILILSKELEKYRNERDQFKLMSDQLRERYSALRKKVEGWGPSLLGIYDGSNIKDREQGLVRLLCELKEQNKSLVAEVEDLRQKLSDSDGDIKLLREQIARQRVGSFDEGISNRLYPAQERESLVKDLESTRQKCKMLETDLQALFDEKEELVTTRDAHKNKVDRLNRQVHGLLNGGDDKKIIDIDSILMENRYLQERLKQTQEEKSMVVATLSKYKSMLEKKKSRFSVNQNNAAGTVVVTHRQVQELLNDDCLSKLAETPANVADLRSLSIALYESLNDKKLALSHQRKANKILGTRVTELENKLKSPEVRKSPELRDGETPTEVPSDPDGAKRTNSSDDRVDDERIRDVGDERLSDGGRLNCSRNAGVNSVDEDYDASTLCGVVRSVTSCTGSTPVTSPKNLARQSRTDQEHDLPPSLQKLFDEALDDIDKETSKSAVIETLHTETRLVKRSNSESSDPR